MSATLTMGRIEAASPRFKAPGFRAKMASVLYLLGVLTAAFTEIIVRGGLNVAGSLVAVVSMILVTLLFYDTFSPVNRSLSLLAAAFNLAGLTFEVLRLQPQGVNIAILFDGFYCVLIGCIALKSTFVPRMLGVLMALGGLGWLTFLSSPLANYLSPYNLAFGLLGEGSVCLWILLTGVNVRRRNEPADSAGRASCVAATRAPLSGAI
jgi:hypothetical protein